MTTSEKPRIRAYHSGAPHSKGYKSICTGIWSVWYVDQQSGRVFRVDDGLEILFQEWKDLRLFEVPYVGY